MTMLSLSPDSGSNIQAHRPTWCGPRGWGARMRLAAYYRIFAQLGWTELIYNHITLRLQPENDTDDDDSPTFLTNPLGLTYAEACASSLVKTDLQDNVRRTAGQPDWLVNPTSLTVHAAIHAGIPSAHCVIHTHTTAGMAVAYARDDLSISNLYAAQLHSKVAYHDFGGITVHAGEGPRLARNIGDKPAVILRNHGLLAWGDSIARVFAVLWLLNHAYEIQLASTSMDPMLEIPRAIAHNCTHDSLQFNPDFDAGEDVLAALIRTIDHIDSSYRT